MFETSVPEASAPNLSALLPYGWRTQPLPLGAESARVIRHDGATLTIIVADSTRSTDSTGGVTHRSVGNRTDLEPEPTVGDWIAVAGDRVVEVLPRTSLLRRRAAEGLATQALAANVDVVLVTCGLDRPVKAGRIHRSVALARDANAVPVLVLTKAAGAEPDVARLQLEHPGVEILVTSAREGIGVEAVRAAIAGRTAVLLGESGAGKSTLVNALLGDDRVDTGRVRTGDAKGRHTTTSRELHLVPGGGVIIDTPGIRTLGLVTDADAVDASFTDILELASRCRFRDCRHESEPECAVREAIDAGELATARYDSWRRLQREVANAIVRASPHEQRRRGKTFSRAAKEGARRKRG